MQNIQSVKDLLNWDELICLRKSTVPPIDRYTKDLLLTNNGQVITILPLAFFFEEVPQSDERKKIFKNFQKLKNFFFLEEKSRILVQRT